MTPKWVERLVTEVCTEAGADEPTVTWRRSRDAVLSSGRHLPSDHRIVVTAGSDRRDQRLVVLHELAHHLTPGVRHGDVFWAVAWRLYQQYGNAAYALKREAGYRANATTVAVRQGIRGAKAAAITATEDRAKRRTTHPRNVCPMPAEQAAAHGYKTPHTHYVGTVHRWTNPDGTWTDYWTPSR